MKNAAAIFLAGLWMTASEFLRNELLVQKLWIDHYRNLGLTFSPNPLVSGPLWMVWCLIFAAVIWKMSRTMSFVGTLSTAWLAGFPLMWITLFNLQVLPLGTLWAAVPLSMLEVAGAVWIIKKVTPPAGPSR